MSRAPTIRVQPEPFDVAAEIAALGAGGSEIGGIGCFVGLVRGAAGARPLRALILEHYPAMTVRALAAVADRAMERWPLLGCTIIHRIGRLVPGEPIVLVLAASPHREAALEATHFLIDWLKTRAPFWKQEEGMDGERYWISQTHQDAQATSRWE